MKRKRFSEEQIIGVLKESEAENAKLKRIVADQMLDMTSMKELLAK